MNNKEVLKYCVNYYDIINFEPIKGDNITPTMVNLYKKYIFSTDLTHEDVINLQNVDRAMKKYIDDCIFRKDMQDSVLNIKVPEGTDDILKLFIDNVISFYTNYEMFTSRKIYVSKWI